MKKSELKDGMIVEYRDGSKRTILEEYLYDELDIQSYQLNKYNDDLIDKAGCKDLDIVKVYESKLIWEREEPKPAFKVGDIVMITDDSAFCQDYSKGDVGKIIAIIDKSYDTAHMDRYIIEMLKDNREQSTRKPYCHLKKIGVEE